MSSLNAQELTSIKKKIVPKHNGDNFFFGIHLKERKVIIFLAEKQLFAQSEI